MANQQQPPPEMPKHSLITKMATQFGLVDTTFITTLKKTIFPISNREANNEEIAAFLVVADKYQLDPFIKEIYAFPGKNGGIVPIVSIDGWLSLINRQPDLDGFDFDEDWQTNEEGERYLVSITVKIYRKSRSHPVVVTEYMSECFRNTDPWKKWPVRMLRHKTLIQGGRYAFGLSGIYDPDEAERIAEAGGDNAPVMPKSEPIADKTKANAADLRDKVSKAKAPQTAPEPEAEPTPEVEANIVTTEDGPEHASETVVEGNVIDAEILEETDVTEPTEEQITENLRSNAYTIYNDLTKAAQKNVIAGKPLIKEMSREELEAFIPELNAAINNQ